MSDNQSLDNLINNANSELVKENNKQQSHLPIFFILKTIAFILLFLVMLQQWQTLINDDPTDTTDSDYVDILIKANESILSAKQAYGDLPDYLPDPTLSKIVDYQSTNTFYTLSLVGNNHLYYISSDNPSKIHREKINDQ
jgi:hypothetical protein